jgi:hypothetical protein
MSTKRKRIPEGTKLPVVFIARELSDIRDETLGGDACLRAGILLPNGSVRYQLCLDDIEDLQGYVAAAANHTSDRKLQRRLERIFGELQEFLDSYDDQGDLPDDEE